MPNRRPRPAHPPTDGSIRAPALLSALALTATLAIALPIRVSAGQDLPLSSLLQSIARSGVQLIYSSETVTADMRIAPPPPGLSMPQQLAWLLAPFGLGARQLPTGGYVIVQAPTTETTLRVTVMVERDGVTAPAAGAEVTLPAARQSVLTDRQGRAAVAGLHAGIHAVDVKLDGLPQQHRTVRIRAQQATAQLDVLLQGAPGPLEEITVESSRYDAGATLGIAVGRETLAAEPTVGGDAARGLQLLPGAAVAGYSAKTHVRGGRDDETLFRYDGLTLNDPYHLEAFQSLYSAIDPAIVETETSWTGPAPIQFGGRIGAVVDIEPRAVAARTVDAKISNRDTGLLLGSPFDDARGSLFAAARFSNNYSPARWLEPNGVAPEYRDYVLRAAWKPGPAAQIAAGVFAIDDQRDTLNSESTPFDQRARLIDHERDAWIRIFLTLLPTLHSETLISAERSQGLVSGHVDSPGIENGFLARHDSHASVTLREALAAEPTPRWSMRAGVEWTDATLMDSIASQASFLAPFVPAIQPLALVRQDSDVSLRAFAGGYYGGVQWQPTNRTLVDTGLRYDSRRYDTLALSEGHWSFRINLRQRVADSTQLRLGWGQAAQAALYDFAHPAGGTAMPAPARLLNELNLGIEQQLGSHWLLRAEVYDKHERSAFNGTEDVFTPFALLPEIALGNQPLVTQGSRMSGFESRLESDRSRILSGWLSYAWSRAEDRIAGQWVPRSWDQPNAIQLGTRWHRGPWQLTGLYSWHSGWPYTPLLATYGAGPTPTLATVALAARNSARLPAFMSLDLRLSWERPLAGGVFQASVELNDVTDSRTVCCHSYSLAGQPDGSTRLLDTPGYWLGFAPLLQLRWHR